MRSHSKNLLKFAVLAAVVGAMYEAFTILFSRSPADACINLLAETLGGVGLVTLLDWQGKQRLQVLGIAAGLGVTTMLLKLAYWSSADELSVEERLVYGFIYALAGIGAVGVVSAVRREARDS